MTSLILCPECQKAVGFPEGTHPSAQVRCPLCEKEFTLGEAIPDDVAELVIVDPGFVAAESEAAADANQSNESLGMAAGGEAASLTGATETEGAPDATDEDSEETMFFEGGVPDGTADIEGKEGDVSFDDFGFGDTADGDGTEVKDKEADEEKEK